VAEINLDHWYEMPNYQRTPWLRSTLQNIHKDKYENNERIVFVLTCGDEYDSDDSVQGRIARSLAHSLAAVDISNFFCVLICGNAEESVMIQNTLDTISTDTIPIKIETFSDENSQKKKRIAEAKEISYTYNSVIPIKIELDQLTDRERFLLTESKTFCMLPWLHLHAYPTGEAMPCCMAEHNQMQNKGLGNCRETDLKDIWNGEHMKQLRSDMLAGRENSLCRRCYEQENSGFLSGRQTSNKHFGHHINLVSETQPDGSVPSFRLRYWDIRFSNLCNFKCRTCGHPFSSQWYTDQLKLADETYGKNHKAIFYAGRDKDHLLDQLLEHIDHVEFIYFAGGEPLIMEEHYRILDALEKKNRFDVRLIYNTNFSEIKLKDRLVFDYWRKFKSVAVGASLDAMGPRAEYIRKGTHWDTIVSNREKMLESCPDVDFYISATLSVFNAWHLPDFHRDWVERGLIKPQDFNINILQDPTHYRIDIAPIKYKQRIRVKIEEHLEWLTPRDKLARATQGYRSAINFMMANDNSDMISKFWQKTNQLDEIRQENLLHYLPELEALSD
jgi:MoaA/NifB/PqqE/SkfB family radical SAM enzyme